MTDEELKAIRERNEERKRLLATVFAIWPMAPTHWVARFAEHIEFVSDGCWFWHRPGTNGYGQFTVKRSVYNAHRLSYEWANGPVARGLQLDHLCKNPACVRPDHLEAVTSRENTLRSSAPSAANATKTTCLRGHVFDEENTYRNKKGRACKECMRQANRRYRAARKGYLKGFIPQ